MEYKRILIISHNCLSKTGSNGRTLGNYLKGWPQDKIAQIYIHAEYPDFSICNNYFCVTDTQVFKSVLNRKRAGNSVVEKQELQAVGANENKKKKHKSFFKNSLFFILRNSVWNSKFWNREQINTWVANYKPEVILVQAGDAPFLFDFACGIKDNFNAQLVVYNTEGYYFKKASYLPENIISKRFFPVYIRKLKKSYDKMVGLAKAEIYNCDLLRCDYERVFHSGSRVIYNSSEFTNEAVYKQKKKQIIYAGNLGLNRHKSLIHFAEALQEIEPDMCVDVYGKTDDEEVKKELEACETIRFHGFISYDELKQKLKESRYLLHIESFDDFYKEDLKYAFSTKIADSLAVGACLFVYAPENMAVIQYLKGKEAAALITDPAMLKDTIKNVMNDPSVVDAYSRNGRNLAEENHSIEKNREEFQSILLDEGKQ